MLFGTNINGASKSVSTLSLVVGQNTVVIFD